MSIASVFHILGWLISSFGLTMVVPMVVSFISGGTSALDFLLASALSVFVGGVFVIMNQTEKLTLMHRDAFLLTLLTWVFLGIFGAFPIYFSGLTPTFVSALFESISGLTTTGASVLSNLEQMDKGILLWRSMLQWYGGMGVIVLATAVMPFLGVGGMQLYKAEMPGVVKDKLQPRLKETASLLWIVYLTLTVICALAYFFAGMNMFDAICHAFATLSSGGFSTHDTSMAYFDSPLIEGICVFFMLMAAVNFSLHFSVLSSKSLKAYVRDSEFKLFIGIVCAAVVLMTFKLMASNVFAEGDVAFRYALFNAVSIITTTGFATVDYSVWPVMIPMMAILLMFVGGCAGSTSGGLKIMRMMIISRLSWRELIKMVHPRAIIPLKISGQTVPPQVLQSVWSFAGLYVICFVFITWVLSLFNLDLVTSFSAAAATITSLGPGLGSVGPVDNYAHIPDMAKLVLCFSMLLGRLELFTLLIILTPAFWRK